jgi:hypothetical protein
MGMVNLRYNPTAKYISDMKIDAFLTETYQFQNDVTDVPVEEGVNVTDHVVGKPDVIQVSAFIGQAEFTAYNGDTKDLDSPSGTDKKQRIMNAYKELLRLKREMEPITVTLGLDTFKNMIITSFNIDRDAETGADLAFDMTFNEIKIVKSQSVSINSAQIKENTSATDQAAGTGNIGTAATEEASPYSDIYKEAKANVDSMGYRVGDNEGLPL